MDVRSRHGVFVNESTAHLTALVSGLGVGQTFGFMARPHLDAGTLVRLLPEWGRPLHPLHIVFHPSRNQSARLRAFVDWVVELFARYDCSPRR